MEDLGFLRESVREAERDDHDNDHEEDDHHNDNDGLLSFLSDQ